VLAASLVLCLLGVASGCGREFSADRPTAEVLGRAALDAKYVTDPDDEGCVGDLLYRSGLNDRWLKMIVNGALDQESEERLPIDEGDYGPQTVAYYEVEDKMLKKCGVHPWPELDRWPSDPDKFY
jgi:hypothetical protein